MNKLCFHLDDNEQTDPCTHLGRVSVHAGHHIHDSLANGDDHPKHWKHLKILQKQDTHYEDVKKKHKPIWVSYISEPH